MKRGIKQEIETDVEREVKRELNRDIIQHIVYGIVIVAVVVGIMLYQNSVTAETRQMLSQEISQLNQQLVVLQSALEQRVGDLEQGVTKLNVTLEKKSAEIRSLTGELDMLRVESAKQLSDLEEKVSGLKSQFQDFSDVIEDSIPGVVSVRTDVGLGSGFIVHGDGYIVTNYHVIDGARAATIVTSDGENHAVRLVGGDKLMDIAVLDIDGTVYTRLSWGDSDSLKVGEKVIAVGNPGGLDFSVTQGIVSAVNRGDSKGRRLIQIDVPINPGNSGGPLINTAGRVVGVNTLKIAGFEGVGFALASNYVRDFIEDVITEDGQ